MGHEMKGARQEDGARSEDVGKQTVKDADTSRLSCLTFLPKPQNHVTQSVVQSTWVLFPKTRVCTKDEPAVAGVLCLGRVFLGAFSGLCIHSVRVHEPLGTGGLSMAPYWGQGRRNKDKLPVLMAHTLVRETHKQVKTMWWCPGGLCTKALAGMPGRKGRHETMGPCQGACTWPHSCPESR